MNTELDNRESKVLDFINAKANIINAEIANDKLQSSPEMKMKKLNEEYKKAPSICIDTIIGRLYKDALPFDDPKKNCSDDECRDAIHAFIDKRTGGKNSEWYIREAIKRTNSPTLNTLLSESTAIAKRFLLEKSKDIGTINVKDLNFNMNKPEEINKITKKLEFDEISSIIQDNVQKAINDESEKNAREMEYNKQIEDSLTSDPEVQDDTSMESAIEKMNIIKQPVVYQPSLFEAILIGSANNIQESTNDSFFHEAVHEYTKLNIVKALKLESFDLKSLKLLANSYLK